MKSAPLINELAKHPDIFQTLLVHTGQHYDYGLSQLFFEELGMPKPDIYLGVGSGSHAQQTARIMVGLEQVFDEQKPDLVIVFGDVNSTMAAAIVAAKMGTKLAHVEAGLRSFDNTMPEEINRIVTDRLADFCFVTEESGSSNLRNEGVAQSRIFFAGNIMIDSLINHLEACQKSSILKVLSLKPQQYATMTLHRPSNVDNRAVLEKLLHTFGKISSRIPIVFPCHPRTRKELIEFKLLGSIDNQGFRVIDPLGYLDFLMLQSSARFVLTDSGGVQEESTYLKIPCITLRYNTERPVTVTVGTNVLTGPEPERILSTVDQILAGKFKPGQIPELWDGKTAMRIVDILIKSLIIGS
jgi:UDP-N-acetylglucosamine 2-epimerase (non-hydrolysing)